MAGASVIDWHRLNLQGTEHARRLVENHDLSLDDAKDLAFTEHVKREAITFLRRHFSFAIPKPVEESNLIELLVMASGKGHRQLCACTILKTIQIINHMAGRELLFRLPVSDRDLFHLVEEKVYRVVGTMLSEGFPITEFIGGRKNLDSTYTKLLSKPESDRRCALRQASLPHRDEDARRHLAGRPLPHRSTLSVQLRRPEARAPTPSSTFGATARSTPKLAGMIPEFQGTLDDDLTPGDNRLPALRPIG